MHGITVKNHGESFQECMEKQSKNSNKIIEIVDFAGSILNNLLSTNSLLIYVNLQKITVLFLSIFDILSVQYCVFP